MIKMLRIDERLIHGQVAIVWTKVLQTTHIVLVNDSAAASEMQKMTLKMAVPNGVKFSAKNVADGIKLLNDPRSESLNIMVVVGNPKDALTLAQEVRGIILINIGNYGLLPGNQSGKATQELVRCVKVDADDLKVLKQIADLDIPFEAQLTPDTNKAEMKKLLRGE